MPKFLVKKKHHSKLWQFWWKNSTYSLRYCYLGPLYVLIFSIFSFLLLWCFFLTDFWIFSGFPIVRTFLDRTSLKIWPWAYSMAHFEGMMLCYNINAVLGFKLAIKFNFQTVEHKKYAKSWKNRKKSCAGFFPDISYSEWGKMSWVDLFGFFVPYMSLILEYTLNTLCLCLITWLNRSSWHHLEKNHAPKTANLGHFLAYNSIYSELSISLCTQSYVFLKIQPNTHILQ